MRRIKQEEENPPDRKLKKSTARSRLALRVIVGLVRAGWKQCPSTACLPGTARRGKLALLHPLAATYPPGSKPVPRIWQPWRATVDAGRAGKEGDRPRRRPGRIRPFKLQLNDAGGSPARLPRGRSGAGLQPLWLLLGPAGARPTGRARPWATHHANISGGAVPGDGMLNVTAFLDIIFRFFRLSTCK